jgi:nucleoside-diphosphate-sugar epimerase
MTALLAGRRIAVTGAGGFLGRHAVQAIAAAGANVTALVGPPGEGRASPPGATTIAHAEVCDAAAMGEFTAGADTVVHLAGPPSVVGSFRDPTTYVRVHAQGTATLLEACRAQGVRTLVYVSSAEVYGRPVRSPVGEDHPLSARSPYAAAKICAEKLVEACARAYGLRAIILRPFSVYGPGASPESLISQIIALARAGRPIGLRDLKPVRDYCYVTDFAHAVVRACPAEPRAVDVFNVGTMRGASVAEVARLLLTVLGTNALVQESVERDRPEGSEIYQLVADNRLARSSLLWEPVVPLEDGLRRVACAA